VREHSARRARRRRTGAAALAAAAVLVVGGAAFGLDRQDSGHSSVPGMPTGVVTTSPSASPSPVGTTSQSAGEGSVTVRLSAPAQYAAATANKVELTIDNSGPARHVVVEFDAPGSRSLYWVEPCDSGVGGCCSTQTYQGNPLRVATGQGSARPGRAL
jgi:hypothetical protein